MREIVERTSDPYSEHTRAKSGGGSRPISVPDPLLMQVQRWILEHVLGSTRTHPNSFAYTTGVSIKDCANVHLGASWLIKLDLRNFFGSIDENAVYSAFRRLGYGPLVSLEMARICTRPAGPRMQSLGGKRRYASVPSYAVESRGVLPQGAPTSGALANLVALRLDQQLSELATTRGVAVTRYSDDIAISAGPGFTRRDASELIARVARIAAGNGFELQDTKTRVIPPGARHVVLGLLVDGDSVRLVPEFKRRISTHVRGVSEFGLVAHTNHRGFRSAFSLINHVDGCIAFSQGIEPAYAASVRARWTAALNATNYPAGIGSER
nr:reverse transcriptase family protein [Demequina sp. TTPB684]